MTAKERSENNTLIFSLSFSSCERSDCAFWADVCGEGGQHQWKDLHHQRGGHVSSAVSGQRTPAASGEHKHIHIIYCTHCWAERQAHGAQM